MSTQPQRTAQEQLLALATDKNAWPYPEQVTRLLDAYRAEVLAEEAARQRAAADRLPEHLAAARPLIHTVADLIDPDALVWFAPARVRDAASDLLAAAEAACVRLWLIEQTLAAVDASQDPAGIVGDLGHYLDGPVHPSNIAAYHAAQEA